MGSRGGFHVTHSSSHRLRMSFSSYLLCWVLSTGWMRVSVGRPMTSESEHCCRDSRGRTAAATGSGSTRTGPWPSPWACRHRPWHPSPSHRCRLFSFWGACSVPAAPAGRGAQCGIVQTLMVTLRMRKFRSAGPVGFPAESPKFRKMPIQAAAVAWQIQSRGNSTKNQTALHTPQLQRLVCGLSKTREFRTSEDSKPGLLRVSARSRTSANTTRRVAVQRTRRVAHSRIRARGRIFSPFRPTRADSSPRVGVASRVSVAMSKMTEKAALLPPVQG